MKKIIFITITATMFLSCGKLIKSIQPKGSVNTDTIVTKKTVKYFVDSAVEKGYYVEALDSGIYMMDFPLVYEDETVLQKVYLRDWYDEANKKQTYFINSYVCDYNKNLDLIGILREAEYGRMSVTCLKTVPDDNGGTKEALYSQTAVPATFINGNFDEFMAVVYEVASNASYIDRKFNYHKDTE